MSDWYDEEETQAAYDVVDQRIGQHIAAAQIDAQSQAAHIAHQQWLLDKQYEAAERVQEKAHAIFAEAAKVVPGLNDERQAAVITKRAMAFMPDDALHNQEGAVAAYQRADAELRREAEAARRAQEKQRDEAAWQEIANSRQKPYWES